MPLGEEVESLWNYQLMEHMPILFQIVGDYFITAPTHLFAERLAERNVDVYVYHFEYISILDQWEGRFLTLPINNRVYTVLYTV